MPLPVFNQLSIRAKAGKVLDVGFGASVRLYRLPLPVP